MEQYLKTYQPHIHQLFSSALKRKTLSHAYLLSGDASIPLQSIALFLAQSLLCEHPSPLADGTCLTCQRFSQGHYTDITIIDGTTETIKKQDIISLEERFALTGLESNHPQIYLLYHVDNMTIEAVNALLKFLEEPQQEIYAILTTSAIEKIIPTILSRTQTLTCKPVAYRQIIQDAITEGIDASDAELLASTTSNVATMKTFMTEESYQLNKQALLDFLKHWISGPEHALFSFRRTWLPLMQSKQDAQRCIDWIILILKQIVRLQQKQGIELTHYGSMVVGLQTQVKAGEDKILHCLKTKHLLDMQVHIPLSLDNLVQTILER
jgi:DNA polymerase-3 subunit delta'